MSATSRPCVAFFHPEPCGTILPGRLPLYPIRRTGCDSCRSRCTQRLSRLCASPEECFDLNVVTRAEFSSTCATPSLHGAPSGRVRASKSDRRLRDNLSQQCAAFRAAAAFAPGDLRGAGRHAFAFHETLRGFSTNALDCPVLHSNHRLSIDQTMRGVNGESNDVPATTSIVVMLAVTPAGIL